jgi:hypothetical protein
LKKNKWRSYGEIRTLKVMKNSWAEASFNWVIKHGPFQTHELNEFEMHPKNKKWQKIKNGKK